jgi:MATE family multidrug resistance protein
LTPGKAIQLLRERWSRESGYRDVLVLAIPLILSRGAISIQHFVDRVFLTWHSPEAVASAFVGGMLSFLLLTLFIATAGYTSTFVAQYHGAGREDRIGPAVWQGLYVAAVGGAVHLLLIVPAGSVFRLIGHAEVMQQHETAYFRILCLGAGPAIASAAMSGFFSGRGRPWPTVVVTGLQTGLNMILDYVLIFGKWGLPALGAEGAAIATVASVCFSCVLYLGLIMRRTYDRTYHTWRGRGLNAALLARLVRFGLPYGVQFFLDVAGFVVFAFLVGRLGTASLAATTITFNINSLNFLPMVGFGVAVSVLVGRHLGANRPDLAVRSVYSALHMTVLYTAVVGALFVLVPGVFLRLFGARGDPDSFAALRETVVLLLRFVAVYCVFDGVCIVVASALRGAGDTRFVMLLVTVVSALVLVIPNCIVLGVLNASVYVAWTFVAAYIITLAFGLVVRFLGGRWRSMRVIEEAPTFMPPQVPETPPSTSEP